MQLQMQAKTHSATACRHAARSMSPKPAQGTGNAPKASCQREAAAATVKLGAAQHLSSSTEKRRQAVSVDSRVEDPDEQDCERSQRQASRTPMLLSDAFRTPVSLSVASMPPIQDCEQLKHRASRTPM